MRSTAPLLLLLASCAHGGAPTDAADARPEVATDATPPADAPTDAISTADAPSDATTPFVLPTRPLAIGYWCGVPMAYLSQARFTEMAQAGFTIASNPCDGTSYSAGYNVQMLAFAHAAGMTAIVSDARTGAAVQGTDVTANLDAVTHDYATAPGLAGYFLQDEPGAAGFPALATVVAGLRTRDPAHVALVNLLPDYASAAQLGTASYDAYVAQFVTTVAPQVFSYDHYNFGTDGSDGAQFFLNLGAVRAQSVAAHVPFWQYIQALSFNGHRATNGPEKRWAALHTLAYGGAGVMYFTYWTPADDGEGFGLGILDASGNRTSQYADVQAINATLAAIGRYTSAAVSSGVFHNGVLAPGAAPRAPGQPVYVPSAAAITVGLFTVPGSSDAYALLVNRDHTATTTSDVWLASADGAPEALTVSSGAFAPMPVLAHDAAMGARVNVTLAPGDGLLVHLRGPIPAGAPGPEAYVGVVRADQGSLVVVDSRFGTQRVEAAGWNQCPTGYTLAGRDFESNGFWLCARSDLASRTFYVGNVVSNAGNYFRVAGGAATADGGQSWDTCAGGTLLAHQFDSNGFWLCME